MSNRRFYITTAIPYVNGDPHLGFALECVQADVLARHRRLRGDQVRFLSGTDDHALKWASCELNLRSGSSNPGANDAAELPG